MAGTGLPWASCSRRSSGAISLHRCVRTITAASSSRHPATYLILRRTAAATQVGGGLLADKIGGKKVLGFGVVWWSIATVMTPIAANMGMPVLLFSRAMMGVGEGVAMPAMNSMLSRCANPQTPSPTQTNTKKVRLTPQRTLLLLLREAAGGCTPRERPMRTSAFICNLDQPPEAYPAE
jgi:hypothetical protein